jgi:murein DD-endopeptidase MepM/ murein hydrolase activator NlpD
MKYILIFFTFLPHVSLSGQLAGKAEIKKFTAKAYSAKEFRQIADSLQMNVFELSDYPVIFPVKGPVKVSSGFGMRNHPIYKVRKFHCGIDERNAGICYGQRCGSPERL